MPKQLKTLEQLQNDIETILNKCTSQRSPLGYRALRQIAREQGWKEDKSLGKGDHRSFRMKGYANITVDCPGEGHELNAHVARLTLREIYQPAIDKIISQLKDESLDLEIDDRIRSIVESLDAFSSQALQLLSQDESIRAIAVEEAKSAQQQIAEAMSYLEKIRNEQLEKCMQASEGLIEPTFRRLTNN
jgi:hypothetical protein